MKSKTLANEYHTLTPEERVPLLFAAAGREDAEEASRLARSAPTVAFRGPDFLGLAHTLHAIATATLMELQDHAGDFLTSLDAAESLEGENAQRMLDVASAWGYLLKVKTDWMASVLREESARLGDDVLPLSWR